MLIADILMIILGLGVLGILCFVIGCVIYDMYQDRKLWCNKSYYKLFGNEFYPYNGKYVFGNNYMCKIRPSLLNRTKIICALVNNTTIKVLVYCTQNNHRSIENDKIKDNELRIRYFVSYRDKGRLARKTLNGGKVSFIKNPKVINSNFNWFYDYFDDECVYELNPKSIVGWKPEGKISIFEFNKHICT